MTRKRIVHPVDLLALVLAIGLAVLAYVYLFHRTPVPRPVDPLLGAELVVEFPADRAWKRSFPETARTVTIADYLEAEVLGEPGPAPDRSGWRRLRLRILERDRQRPEGLTLFRTGIRRGATIGVHTKRSEVRAEVVEVRAPGADS